MYSAYITVSRPDSGRLGRAGLLRLVSSEAPGLARLVEVAQHSGDPVLRLRRVDTTIRTDLRVVLHILDTVGYRWHADLTAGTENRLDADTLALARAGGR
jgi:hypothetical protein